MMTSLTIIVPVYNEEDLVIESLSRLDRVGIINKVIIVDDCSTDNSFELINKFIENKTRYQLIKTKKNLGKGKAIEAAQPFVETNYLAIHDADLEYFPDDLIKMYEEINGNNLIIGSRFIGDDKRKNLYKRTLYANYFLSKLFSVVHKKNITDIATCYKMIPSTFFQNFKINSSGFEFEVEVLAEYLKINNQVIEVPIKYEGRSYEEGKKIRMIDGFKYIFWILKSRL